MIAKLTVPSVGIKLATFKTEDNDEGVNPLFRSHCEVDWIMAGVAEVCTAAR